MLYVYIVVAAALIPIIDRFVNLTRNSNSWWLVPLLFVGFFLAFVILHLLVFVVSIALVNVEKQSDKLKKYYRILVNITLPMVFKLGLVKIHLTGEDKIPEDKRVMLVCNHIHDFDPAVIISCLPKLELGFIAKREVYTELPFVAKMMTKLNCLPINRENNREAAKTILKAVEYIKTDKASIGIFPEGYTSKDGELQPLRNGCFKIATRAKCPIVVCTLVNSNIIVKNMFRRKCNVYLDVLEVISEEEILTLTTEQIGDRIHKEMFENIKYRRNEE